MSKVFLFRIVSKDVWSSIDSSLLFPLIGDVSSYTVRETGGVNVVIHMRGRALPGIEGGLEGGPMLVLPGGLFTLKKSRNFEGIRQLRRL